MDSRADAPAPGVGRPVPRRLLPPRGPVTGDARGGLALPGAGGALGSLLVVAGAVQRGSPFSLRAGDAWFFGSASGATTTGGGTTAQFAGIMLVYGGTLLLVVSWLELLRRVRAAPGVPPRRLAATLASWALPIVVAPPLFSRDVYAYVAQGQLTARGLDPYVDAPSRLGAGHVVGLVDPLWRHATAPYGPVWERLSGAVGALAGGSVPAAVAMYRALAVVGCLLLAWAVVSLARSEGTDAATALALAVLNPLVLLDVLGGSHNDALMLGLLACSIALARRGHLVTASLVCAVAAEVKVPALLGAVFIGWWWSRGRGTARWRGIVAGVGLTGLAMVAVNLATGLGWRWVGAVSGSGTVVSWLDPATAAGLLVARMARLVGVPTDTSLVVRSARDVALLVAGALVLVALARSERLGDVAALGWSFLAVAVLGPVVWPWYEAWGIAFLAVAARGRARAVVVVASIVACFATVPSPRLLVTASPVLVAGCWLLVVGGAVAYAATRLTPLGAPGRPAPS